MATRRWYLLSHASNIRPVPPRAISWPISYADGSTGARANDAKSAPSPAFGSTCDAISLQAAQPARWLS
jgi:hypothetical protein